MNLKILPQPKKLVVNEGFLKEAAVIALPDTSDSRLNNALKKLPVSPNGVALNIKFGEVDSEVYTLEIDADGITLASDGVKGIFYGIQTLRQLFAGERVPYLYIEDKPDMVCRGFYQDITRGRIPTVDTLKSLVDRMAYFKLNMLQLYSEHVFDLKELKGVTAKNGCITAEEIKELDKYCRENFIELIPSIATFGHLYEFLNQDEYKHLRILKDYEPTNIFWDERAYHHTLDPFNPESLKIVKSMLDQCIEMFPSDTINICGDETFDLKTFKDENTGRLYVDYMNEIIKYLTDKGKKVMMWADIIFQTPETVAELPESVTLLSWDYSKVLRRYETEECAKMNRPVIVCPGCNTWTRLIEDTDINTVNIPGMADLAHECGSLGILNTNWGDWGNPCSLELAMYGFLLGAEKSWSVATAIDSDFDEKINSLYYKNGNAINEIRELSAMATDIPWWHFGAYYSNGVCEHGNLEVKIPSAETLTRVTTVCRRLIDRVSAEAWGNEDCKEELLTAGEGVLHMAETFARIIGLDIEPTVSAEAWIARYRKNWMLHDKESELKEIEKMFRFMAKQEFGSALNKSNVTVG